MKKIVLLSLVAALLTGATFPTATAAEVKIGTVDMKRVFEGYYKTKEAEQRINEARNEAKKQLEDRSEMYKKAVGEVQKLDEDVRRTELSPNEKDKKQKLRDEKITDLKMMEREIQEFQSSRESQLQQQSVRMRSGIVEEINKVVSDRVKAEQFDIVFDRSGPSLNGVPVILYAKDSYDFTTEVVSALNKDRGTVREPVADASTTTTTRPAFSPTTGTTTKKPK